MVLALDAPAAKPKPSRQARAEAQPRPIVERGVGAIQAAASLANQLGTRPVPHVDRAPAPSPIRGIRDPHTPEPTQSLALPIHQVAWRVGAEGREDGHLDSG